jgi:hypothetical protein
MATSSYEINRLKTIKDSLRNALAARGIVVPDDVPIDEYYKYVYMLAKPEYGLLMKKTVNYSNSRVNYIADNAFTHFHNLETADFINVTQIGNSAF